MKDGCEDMDIRELCRKSGTKRQVIEGYLRSGLLDKPTMEGLNQPVFSEHHLRVLRRIRRLREEEGLTLAKIRTLLNAEKRRKDTVLAPSSKSREEQIMDKATVLFSKNGYSNTKISDITEALGLGKGTFYLYFNSKKDLFLECINRLTMIIVPKETWNDVRQERDFIERQRIKLTAFLKTFPTFSGILNLLRLSFLSEDATAAKKAKKTLKTLAGPLMKDLTRAIADGVCRGVNVEITSVLLLGMAENLGYMIMMDPRITIEEGREVLLSIMTDGLLLPESERPGARNFPCSVVDSRGLNLRLNDIRFDGDICLPGTFGQAELRVALEDIMKIQFKKGRRLWVADVTLQTGEQIILNVDRQLMVSGKTAFGDYKVSLGEISEISLSHKLGIGASP